MNYSQTFVKRPYKTRHILAFQTAGCLLLHESSVEGFLCYFLSAISDHLSIAVSFPELVVAYNRFHCILFYFRENISSSLADILHYRSCRSHWIEQGTCLSNRQRFTDDTMLRVIPRVRDRLIALRETLLSPPFNKTHM